MRARVQKIRREIPTRTHGLRSDHNNPRDDCFMPMLSRELPSALETMTRTTKRRVLRLVAGTARNRLLARALLGDEFLAFAAQRQVLSRFLVEALALAGIEYRLSHHAPGGLRAEIVFAVEALDPIDELGAVEA